jgi:hypothetical protein
MVPVSASYREASPVTADDRLAAAGLEPPKPSVARMYDYFLGGKDNYAIDREAAERIIAAHPQQRRLCRNNRSFLVRAVRYVAERGISQFVDLGTGIPTSPNVHEVAGEVNPQARVVYIDNDPVVQTHNEALLATREGVVAVDGDMRHPQKILERPELSETVDFSKPVMVLFVAVFHFIAEADDPKAIVSAFTDRMAPGSYLAISTATSDDTDPAVIQSIQEIYATAEVQGVFRTQKRILELFNGLELVSPGLVDVSQWRSPWGDAKPTKIRIMAGLGRKG